MTAVTAILRFFGLYSIFSNPLETQMQYHRKLFALKFKLKIGKTNRWRRGLGPEERKTWCAYRRSSAGDTLHSLYIGIWRPERSVQNHRAVHHLRKWLVREQRWFQLLLWYGGQLEPYLKFDHVVSLWVDTREWPLEFYYLRGEFFIGLLSCAYLWANFKLNGSIRRFLLPITFAIA